MNLTSQVKFVTLSVLLNLSFILSIDVLGSRGTTRVTDEQTRKLGDKNFLKLVEFDHRQSPSNKQGKHGINFDIPHKHHDESFKAFRESLSTLPSVGADIVLSPQESVSTGIPARTTATTTSPTTISAQSSTTNETSTEEPFSQVQPVTSSIITSNHPTSVYNHPLLIYSTRNEIRAIDIFDLSNHKPVAPSPSSDEFLPSFAVESSIQPLQGTKLSRSLISGLKNTIGLDFYYSDSSESFIYWSDVADERIYRGIVSSGTIKNVEIVLQNGLATAEGLAIDWIGNNIYWVESTLDHIEVANMNGTFRRTLIVGDMESPRAIAVDPRFGLLFWTDWDKKKPRIERATMDGQDREVLVNVQDVQGGWPNGLTIDYQQQKLYWIDASSKSIHVMDYDGEDHQVILKDSKSLIHPFSIALFKEKLFWTDWRTQSVSMTNKFDGSVPEDIQRLPNRLFDIKVFHPNRQPHIPNDLNPCYINNGGCSHLCLLSTNHTRRCECPNLMDISQDGLTCKIDERVLLIGRTNEIKAVDLNEPRRHVMAPITVSKVFQPKQFDFFSKTKSIYWADSQTNEVKRASLIGNNIETILDVIIELPNGLAIDWMSRNIYISSAPQSGSPGKIYISNLKGEYISILMDKSQGVISPKSLTVHPSLGLLFCVDEDENFEPLIFSASMNGTNKQLITSRLTNPNLTRPTSLTIDYKSNRLYWVNQAEYINETSSIQYYDILSGKIVSILDERNTRLEDRINPVAIGIDGDNLIVGGRNPREKLFLVHKNDATNRTILKTQKLDQLSSLKVYDPNVQVGINGCEIQNGNCSQLCIPMNATHKTCRCAIGYSVNPSNETECVGKDSFLIYSYNLGIRGINLEPNSNPDDLHLPPIHRAFRASSIDYVYRDNLIFWVDNEEGSITRINRDTTNFRTIVQSLESEESIAIDYVAGNIYWLDPYYDVIEVAHLNGSSRYVIVSGDMEKANNIVIDPWHGRIAWSDVGSLPKIETARLDGSDRRILVNTNLTHIDDLAIDRRGPGYLYWLDSSIVSRIAWDGSGRVIIFPAGHKFMPQATLVSIAVNDEYLYVADSVSNQGSIFRCPKDGGPVQLVQRNLGDGIRDIAIYSKQDIPDSSINPCAMANGGCQDLCLYHGVPGKRRCICSHGQLNSDNSTCKPYNALVLYSRFLSIDSLHLTDDESLMNNSPYAPIPAESRSSIVSLAVDYPNQRIIYSEMSYQICSVHFNGTDRKVLVDKQSFVEGVAFANSTLYWTNNNHRSISRLNISSSGLFQKVCDMDGKCSNASVEVIVQLSHDDKPRGIAVDICTSYVYWTNWNNNAAIQRASPHKDFQVESIIITDIKMPNGITIDQKMRRLYWCDAKLDKIEVSEMDGSNRIVLISMTPQHPFAVAVSDRYIFWTDWLARGVFRAEKLTGRDTAQIRKLSQRPMGIAIAEPNDLICPTDPCAMNNGGCPPSTSCSVIEGARGQQSVICEIKEISIPRPMRCKITKIGQSCGTSNYHDIIMDGRYNFTGAIPLNLTPSEHQKTSNSELPPSVNADINNNLNRTGLDHRDTIPTKDTTLSTRDTTTMFSTHSDTASDHYNEYLNSSTSTESSTIVESIAPIHSLTTEIPTQNFTLITHDDTPHNITNTTNANNTEEHSVEFIFDVSTPSTYSFQSIKTTIPPTKIVPTQRSPNVTYIPENVTTLPPCQVSTTTQSTTISSTAVDVAKTTAETECPGQFKCFLSAKLTCIGLDKHCDGNADCPAGEDESNCFPFNHGPAYELKREAIWRKPLALVLIVAGAAITAILLIFRPRGVPLVSRRRYWFVGSKSPFSHRRMFDENETNIEISNPVFDEDDSGNMSHCPFSIDLNERTTNFSNPLYERQVLMMCDKNVNQD